MASGPVGLITWINIPANSEQFMKYTYFRHLPLLFLGFSLFWVRSEITQHCSAAR